MGRDSESISASSLLSPDVPNLNTGESCDEQRFNACSTTSHVPLQRVPGLRLVTNTPKGRGVFASEPIPAKAVIETCPVLVLDPKDADDHVSKTQLDHYTYNWPWKDGKTKTQVIVMGLGSMFNHSKYGQNVAWTRDVTNECITYTALRHIAAGEELCISYGNGRLWFHDADAEAIQHVNQADNEELSALHGLEKNHHILRTTRSYVSPRITLRPGWWTSGVPIL